MRELLILRHGKTEANEKKAFSGALDLPLSENGRAELAPLRGKMPQGVLYFTSGMQRARQTLQTLYGPVDSITVSQLSEYNFGRFEMRTHDELWLEEPVYRLWLEENALDVACPGGETRRHFAARVAQGWETLAGYRWEGLAVLVCHGGVIRQILADFAKPPVQAGFIGNGEGWLVRIMDDGVICAAERINKFTEN